MPRKPDMPRSVANALEEFHLRLRHNPHQPFEVRMNWYRDVKEAIGERSARIAWALMEANVPTNQVIQYYTGDTDVTQHNNPGGQNITQKAGGHMVGVNAAGTQTIRDISIYTSELDQAGAVINAPLRNALIEARTGIEQAKIDDAVKPLLIEQFDKLTDELKKGDKKNPGAVKTLWTMVYGTLATLPDAGTCYAAFENLKNLLGF